VYVQDLPRATEAFIAGTTTEVMPLVRIDSGPLGDGTPGPVTRRLQQLFRDRIP
jgi:D-alanine transaminase